MLGLGLGFCRIPCGTDKIQVAVTFVMRVDSLISDLIVCQRTIHKLVLGLAVVGLSIAVVG